MTSLQHVFDGTEENFQQLVIDAVYGAESEISIRGLIDRHVPPIKDIAEKEALLILARAATGNPHSIELHKLALKILLREKRYADIQQYSSVLPMTSRFTQIFRMSCCMQNCY